VFPATSQVPWSLLITFEDDPPLASTSAAVQWLGLDAPPVMVPIPAVPRPMKVMPAAAIADPVIRAADPLRRTLPILMSRFHPFVYAVKRG